MSLFQNNVVKKYTNILDKKILEQKWHLFTTIFHDIAKQENIRNSKEEQYQEGFLRDFFVQILGYTLNPDANYNLISEQKNETNSKKADGAIILNNNVHAIIELKGTETTDLSKIENQAFGYKNNQKDCTYVIISNFEKVRFYIDNATEHIEFNLFALSRAEFDLLYTCLSLESMQTDLPKKIKNESVSNEDKITAALYKDYSTFRKELFADIEKLNPQYNRLLLFKKTQKLLDRFLFIFFAEDRQLLPTNLIFSINLEWQNLRQARIPVSLYDRYKMYFQDLNTGARVSLPAFGKHTNEIVTAQYDIYAYNGGLFQPDELLDTIAITDDLLFKHTKKISEYDFDSEVDVNILGHIFENSLNEIDEITATLTGFETLLGLEEVAIQSESITQSGLQTLSATQSGFQTLTGLDKTKTKRKKDGVFYTPKYITKYIVDNTIGKLCEEKKLEITLDETKYSSDKRITVATKKKLIETLDSYRKWLLQLTIVDPACGSGAFLNQALEFLITEHRYVDELQAKLFGDALVLSDVEGSILENNLFGVDLNEESVEIAKLSLWLRTAQRNRKLNSLNNNIKCGNSLIDDAAIAGEKAFNWQNEFPQVFAKGGFDVVIGNPPYVQYNDTFYGHFITNQCKDLYALFFEKGIIINKKSGMFGFITPSLFIKGMRYESLRKILLEKVSILEIDDLGDNVFQDVQMPTAITILKNISNSNQKWSDFIKGNTLIEKIQIKTIKISEITKIIRGLEIGKDKVNIGLNDVKFLTGEDIFRYGVRNFSFINFEIYNKYKKNEYYFTKDRIIIRETGNRITSVFINQNNIYQNRSLYSIKINDESEFSYSFLLAILNSKIIQYFYKIKFSANTNIFPKIRIGQVNELPIKKISLSDQQPFIEKADVMLSLNKSLQDITQKFSKYFSGQFKLDKLSGKLEKWYSLSFEDFIKEINKAIKTQKGSVLTKKDEFDWIDLFEENKAKANALQHQIATTDKAIDAMVYKLYDLTEDEIAIVENAS